MGKRSISEAQIVRWVCYVSFVVCGWGLIASLTVGWDPVPSLAGTIVFGVPAVSMYTREQQHRSNLKIVNEANRSRGTGRWDVEDSGDPTTPPTENRVGQ